MGICSSKNDNLISGKYFNTHYAKNKTLYKVFHDSKTYTTINNQIPNYPKNLNIFDLMIYNMDNCFTDEENLLWFIVMNKCGWLIKKVNISDDSLVKVYTDGVYSSNKYNLSDETYDIISNEIIEKIRNHRLFTHIPQFIVKKYTHKFNYNNSNIDRLEELYS